MKKEYQAPVVSIEIYELNLSIASNCFTVVHNGPAVGEYEQCYDYIGSEWGGLSRQEPEYVIQSKPHNVNFYEDTGCDCYTTGNGSYWTS